MLAISSGVCLLSIFTFLPETSRSIVGNGSRKVSGVRRTFLSICQAQKSGHVHHDLSELEVGSREGDTEVHGKRFWIPNPVASLKILWAPDTLIITLIYGVFYTNMSCLQASISTLFIHLYDFSEIKAGLIYLPFGLGSCIGAYCSGNVPYDRNLPRLMWIFGSLSRWPSSKADYCCY